MYFLVNINIKTDGTVEKGTSSYDTMKEAVVQFHVAMAAAMQKEDCKKHTCVILNENGMVQKNEVYEVPVSVVEESEESDASAE